MSPSLTIVSAVASVPPPNSASRSSQKRWNEHLNALDTVLEGGMRVITGKHHHGLFSIVFGALREIRQCELSGDLPRVEWGEECAYFENGNNSWEDIFLPVVTGPVDTSGPPDTTVVAAGWDDTPQYPGRTLFETLAVLVAKYARPTQEVWERAGLTDVSNCVGIHYRGTDKQATKEFHGPPPETFCAHALDACRARGITRVFVATDCGKALEKFKTWARSNGLQLVHTTSIRSFNERSVHDHYGMDAGNRRGTNGKEKALQVLVDAILLSKCQHVIRSPSGVSLFALLFNPTLTFECLGELYMGHRWEAFLLDHRTHIRGKRHVSFSGEDPAIAVATSDTAAGVDIFQHVRTEGVGEASAVWVTTTDQGPTETQREGMLEAKAGTLFVHPRHELHLLTYIMNPAEVDIICSLMEASGVKNSRQIVGGKMILTSPGGELFLACSRDLFDMVWGFICTILRGDVKIGGSPYVPGDRINHMVMAVASILAAHMTPCGK